MSYLIYSNELVAKTDEDLKSGESVRVAYDSTTDELHADKRTLLVNSSILKVSNAKKWEGERPTATFSKKIREGEYLLSN